MRSIRVRLIIAMLSLIVILTAILSAVFIQQTASSVIASQSVSLTRIAKLFADRIAPSIAINDQIGIADTLNAINALDNVTGVWIATPEGKEIVRSGTPVAAGAVTTTRLDEFVGLMGPIFKQIIAEGVLSATVPVVRDKKVLANLTINVNTTAIRFELMRIAALAVALATLVGIIGTISAMALQTMITRPLHKLAVAMDIAGRTGRYTETIPEDGPLETAVIARTFNAMITRIGARDQALKERKAELENKVMSRTRDLEVAKDAAESANVAKSVFLATMSHEIRTPLNGMLVMAELLAKSHLDPKRQRYAEVIEASGKTLVNIINDVLDLSKIEAGALTIDPIPVSPHKLVADVIDIFAEKAAAKDVELAGYVNPSVSETVEVDPVRLKQVLSNFVNNAIKFTSEGYVYVEMSQDGDTLYLSVRDTGIGIRPENQSRIFEPFSQEDGATARKYGGTGLGLSICRKLVRAMGGEIGFESEPGEGSVFFASVKCVPVLSGGKAWPSEPLGEMADVRIGVLTSESLSIRVMAQTLTDCGLTIEEVAREAPDAEALSQYDLIIGSPGDITSFVEVLSPDEAYQLRDRLAAAAPPSNAKREWLHDRGYVAHTLDIPASRDSMLRDLRNMLGKTDGEAPARAPVRAGPRYPELRALVADDNAVNREVMAAILDQFDIDAQYATDGAEAVEAYRRTGFDVVFMDINMPVMDGVEAVRRIRAFETDTNASRAAIVALTAHGETLDDRPWQDHGFDHYVGKPVRVADIQAALEKLGIAQAEPMEFEPLPAAEVPSEPMPVDGLVDWSVIDSLTNTMDDAQRRDLQSTVLGIYCDDAPAQFQALIAAVDAENVDDLRMASHALKSVSLNVGAVRVAKMASEIEAAARDGRIVMDTAMRQALSDLVDQTISAFSERTREAA